MVESIKELNRICQKPRYKEVGNWMVRHILRDAALPVTWLLLHTPVTANQVTFVSFLIALWGAIFLASPSPWFFLAGALLLQVWYLLDHVDGQIARYRGTSSLTGRFFDYLTHHVIHGVLFFCLGCYVFRATGNEFYLVWGFITAISIMVFNLIHDTKYKTFMEGLAQWKQVSIVMPQTSEGKGEGENRGGLGKLFSFCHKLCEVHVLMNILTLMAFLTILFPSNWDLRHYLFSGYGVMAPLLAVVKTVFWLRQKRVDREFEGTFREIE